MGSPLMNNSLIRWLDYRLPIFSYLDHELHEYPTPKNLNYWWNFGSLAGFVLVVLIATGIVLAMHYTPHVDYAFASVERIRRDVNYGWLLQYIHMNGGTAFFIVVYIHIFRGMYYGSYKPPREVLWGLGVIILLTMMATAFLGYVLPWGQMSFWGATVITNLFSAIPIIGEDLVTLLWGGFSVDNPTLNRFFSLHYLMPFVIVGIVGLHVIALHTHGSGNPIGIDTKGPQDSIGFHPYYTVKDMFGVGVFLVLFALVIFFAPNMFGEPDNYIPANPMSTPEHIVPEWYFLPYYAILRSITFDIWFIEAKLIGVGLMGAATMVLFLLPWLDTHPVRSARYRPWYKGSFWVFIVVCVILGIVGANAPDAPVFKGIEGFKYVHLGQITTFLYFFFFLVWMPFLSRFEPVRPLPSSISEPVLKGGGPSPSASTAKPMEKA